MMGPEKVAPNWFCRNGKILGVLLTGSKSVTLLRASKVSLRTYSKAEPWKDPLPDADTMSTTPPVAPPNSALASCPTTLNLPSPSIWALSRSIHATTSFDATVAVPGEIYSRALNSLPHRNWCSVDAFSETRQTEWFLSARATRHSELGSTADNFSHTDRRRGSRIARRERALLVRARRPAAEPLHAPAPVARESRSSVFALVAPN